MHHPQLQAGVEVSVVGKHKQAHVSATGLVSIRHHRGAGLCDTRNTLFTSDY